MDAEENAEFKRKMKPFEKQIFEEHRKVSKIYKNTVFLSVISANSTGEITDRESTAASFINLVDTDGFIFKIISFFYIPSSLKKTKPHGWI
jgi:hypothetical protein